VTILQTCAPLSLISDAGLANTNTDADCGSRRSAAGCSHERVARRFHFGDALFVGLQRGAPRGRGCFSKFGPGRTYPRRSASFGTARGAGSRLWFLGKGDWSRLHLFISTIILTEGHNMAINSELRDSETGRLVKEHTPAQREHFLLRHPNVDPATLPPVIEPVSSPAFSTYTMAPKEFGFYWPRKAGLLSDTRSVTKPAVTTLSNHRRNLHESAHGIATYLLGRPIVRVSVLESNGNAGHVLHYNPAHQTKTI
jgi:hypothetical protein